MTKYLDESEKMIKAILLGDSSVGKTSIINQLSNRGFNEENTSTYTSNYIEKVMNINNNEIKLNVWDTAGQEQYRSLCRLFIKDSKIIILVYDITSKKSFESLKYWYEIVENHSNEEITLGIIGNKLDLILSGNDNVSEKLAEEYAKQLGAEFVELSAKNDKKGIDKFFERLLQQHFEGKKKYNHRDSIKINYGDSNKDTKKEKCC